MAAIPADTVKDVVFGASLVVSGFEIISAAVKKQLASAVSFFVAAASVYGTFYL